MNAAVWKQPLRRIDEQEIELTSPGEILHFGTDPGGLLCIWFVASPGHPHKVRKKLRIVGTGHGFDMTGLKYVGTAKDGQFMWHLFERTTA